MIDPKPARRIVDPAAIGRKVASDPRCRLCGKEGRVVLDRVRGINGHHLVSRSARGDDVEANIMPLCGSGTQGCHGDVESGAVWARIAVRAAMTEDEEAYVTEKKGAEWLERRYPRRAPR